MTRSIGQQWAPTDRTMDASRITHATQHTHRRRPIRANLFNRKINYFDSFRFLRNMLQV